MTWYLDAVALVADGWDGEENRDTRARWIEDNKADTTQFIRTYSTIADLTSRIRALIDADPEHPCLRTLEIKAHGDPNSIDNLWSFIELEEDLRPLKSLPWCDNASFYLAGCNTGLTKRGASPPYSGPIARDVANVLAYDAGSFAVHLTVYGSKGYASGGYLSGAAKCWSSYTERVWSFGGDFPWIHYTDIPHETYEGAIDASGNDVWQAFKNGSW